MWSLLRGEEGDGEGGKRKTQRQRETETGREERNRGGEMGRLRLACLGGKRWGVGGACLLKCLSKNNIPAH